MEFGLAHGVLHLSSLLCPEASEAILTTEANKALAQQCPECHRIFEEHSEEELIECIKRCFL